MKVLNFLKIYTPSHRFFVYLGQRGEGKSFLISTERGFTITTKSRLFTLGKPTESSFQDPVKGILFYLAGHGNKPSNDNDPPQTKNTKYLYNEKKEECCV